MSHLRLCRFLALTAAAAAPTAMAAIVPTFVVVKEGDAVAGSTVASLNAPFTDGNGKVSVVAGLADGSRIVWHDTGPIFHSADAAPDVLTGGEGTHGVGNNGEFIYSPSFNGADAVYTQGGKLLANGDPAPGLPGVTAGFNSRPQMLANGTAYWVAGTSNPSGRVLYRATDAADVGTATPVLQTGDVILPGRAIDSSGVGFDYWVSDNGAHHIHELGLDGSTADDMVMWVNGAVVAQEGSPNGSGDNWQNFDAVSINNNGNYVFTGDTDGSTATDEFIAYNGAIALREGDVVDGIILGSAVNAVSINDNDQVAFIWNAANETLFFGDGANLSAAIALLSVGDELDIDGDSIGDYLLTDFNASNIISPGLDLAEDGFVYAEVDMEPIGGGDTIEAIIRVAIPEPASLALLALGGLALLRRRA